MPVFPAAFKEQHDSGSPEIFLTPGAAPRLACGSVQLGAASRSAPPTKFWVSVSGCTAK